MTGRGSDVPEPERRRAANAALTGFIEELCGHYAPAGVRVEDCWEVRDGEGRVALRVFLAGPMQGSWTDAVAGKRGDALDLVAHLRRLDAAGALAEAEAFLSRGADEADAGEAVGVEQMALFDPLGEAREHLRRRRRPGTVRKAGDPGRPERTGGEPAAGVDASRNPAGPGAGENPADRPAPSASGRGPGHPPETKAAATVRGPDVPASDADGDAFSGEDRQHIRKTAEDVAWIRTRLTARSLDAEAHDRASARGEGHGRRRRTGLKAAGIVALAVFGPILGVMVESRYGIEELVGTYGAELAEDARILPGGDGG